MAHNAKYRGRQLANYGKDREEIQELLRKWQKILRLEDWLIMVEVVSHHDLEDSFSMAETQVFFPKMLARMRFQPLDTQGEDTYPVDDDYEYTVVHELLHIPFHRFYPDSEDHPAHPYQEDFESGIDRVARALVDLHKKVDTLGGFAADVRDAVVDAVLHDFDGHAERAVAEEAQHVAIRRRLEELHASEIQTKHFESQHELEIAAKQAAKEERKVQRGIAEKEARRANTSSPAPEWSEASGNPYAQEYDPANDPILNKPFGVSKPSTDFEDPRTAELKELDDLEDEPAALLELTVEEAVAIVGEALPHVPIGFSNGGPVPIAVADKAWQSAKDQRKPKRKVNSEEVLQAPTLDYGTIYPDVPAGANIVRNNETED